MGGGLETAQNVALCVAYMKILFPHTALTVGQEWTVMTMRLIDADLLISNLEDMKGELCSILIQYGVELAIEAVEKQPPVPERPACLVDAKQIAEAVAKKIQGV